MDSAATGTDRRPVPFTTPGENLDAAAALPGRSVLMITEGTYPFVMGGVSTWCDLLLRGLPDMQWEIFAITGGEGVGPAAYRLPQNARLSTQMRLWGSNRPARPRSLRRTARRASIRAELAGNLARGLLGWAGEPSDVVTELVWCRQHPNRVTATFRDPRSWDAFLVALEDVLGEEHPETGPNPDLDLNLAIGLYHTLSWVARTAATPTPVCDVSLVTAAGWACLPAVVDRRLRGTPLLLSEHGLYVREAYLAAIRSGEPAASRFVSTRLARGLTRLTYAHADVVCPVTQANQPWEEALGVPRDRIHPIPNGVPSPAHPVEAPDTRTVVSVGRLDPLKDVLTMLRVAAAVRRRVPDVTFLHYGPVPRGQEPYAQVCRKLHADLGLGDTFRFMGPTKDPTGVMRDADVVLMTSISEGFPMSVLEALSQARPVVTTLVGGVLDAMRGAGLTAASGDVHGLSDAVCTLLEHPALAADLGRRGHARVGRLFSQQQCLDRYELVLRQLAAMGCAAGSAS